MSDLSAATEQVVASRRSAELERELRTLRAGADPIPEDETDDHRQ
jgi:hypothetical protein